MELISILGDTGFLACKECKFAILPSSIENHFLKSPHRLPQDSRAQIALEVANYPSLLHNRQAIKGRVIPSLFPYYFPDLSLY